MSELIKVENLSFSYGKGLALSDVSFSVNEGDFVALVGPNGSGKTTLVKILLGLLKPLSGTYEVKDGVGYVPQKATHFESNFPATVSEIVEMGMLAKKKFPKIINESDRKSVEKALAQVGMEKYKCTRIGDLSGGQQQRVLIAKAIVSKAKVLFLDEPTTGVDQQTVEKFYDFLKELNDNGITIILVSHDVGRVTKYVNKVASLNQKLEFYGTHKDFCLWDNDHFQDNKLHKLCPNL